MSYFFRPLIIGAMNFLDGSDSNNPEKEGKIGEQLLMNAVNNYFDKREQYFKYIKNIHVYYDKDKFTEIDLLLFCKKGVFVIENKHWNGVIKGKFDGDRWLRVQDGYCFSRIYHYNNPYKQNEYHVRVLNELLKEEVPIFSLITFSSNNIGRTGVKNIINLIGFYKFMDEIDTGYDFSNNEIDELFSYVISKLEK